MSKNSDEAEAALAKLKEEATPADSNTETMLRSLSEMAARRREDPVLKKDYEDLRDLLTARLIESGPRYFIGDDGMKRYAVAVSPEPVEVDVVMLMELDEAGSLKAGVLDKVAPRKPDKDAFRRAVSNGSITREQFLLVADLTEGTKFVRFSDPIDEE